MVRLAALALQAHQLQTPVQRRRHVALARFVRPDDPDASSPTSPASACGSKWASRRQAAHQGLQQGRSVIVYCFNHASEIWWKGIETKLTRPGKLQVWRIPTEASQAMAAAGRAQRTAAGHGAGRRAT